MDTLPLGGVAGATNGGEAPVRASSDSTGDSFVSLRPPIVQLHWQSSGTRPLVAEASRAASVRGHTDQLLSTESILRCQETPRQARDAIF